MAKANKPKVTKPSTGKANPKKPADAPATAATRLNLVAGDAGSPAEPKSTKAPKPTTAKAKITLADFEDERHQIAEEMLEREDVQQAAQDTEGGPPCPWHHVPTRAYTTTRTVTRYACRVAGCQYRTKVPRPKAERSKFFTENPWPNAPDA